jgi:NTP pyrophosphatase (non-canonical NTP hydrolase)
MTVIIYPEKPLNDIFNAIITELDRAEAKHPDWPEDLVHAAAIVCEEAGEVLREANSLREGHGRIQELKMELIQTAVTAIRMVKNLKNAEVQRKPST